MQSSLAELFAEPQTLGQALLREMRVASRPKAAVVPFAGKTILDVMDDPAIFGKEFEGGDWNAWRAFLGALFALPCEFEDDLEYYRQYTQRKDWPSVPAREAWMCVGRRGGKSAIAALIAVYLACVRDYAPYLRAGEVGTVAVVASDKKQARSIMNYVRGYLASVPALQALRKPRGETAESVMLTNRVMIEVRPARMRSTRGYTYIAILADEIAFWRTDEAAADPDEAILKAMRPGLSTIPGSMLIGLSSPYAREGVLWRKYDEHFGKDGDPVLVWQAPTLVMHPGDPVLTADVELAYRVDEDDADAEFGAQFRRDIQKFIDPARAKELVVPGRRSLPPVAGIEYTAFVDPSGGAQDSFTCAIAHESNERAIVDEVMERIPPFSPDAVVAEFAATLRLYRISEVIGDRYGGEFPRELFASHGINYIVCEEPKSDLYREFLPLCNAKRVELLDQEKPRSLHQLCKLERRTSRGGRDSIDHPPRGHDDCINVVAGACVKAIQRAGRQGGLLPLVGLGYSRR